MRKSSQQLNSKNSDAKNVVDLDKLSNKQINQQIVILKNIELLKKFLNQKENIPWLLFSKPLKDFSLDKFKIDFGKGIATFRPTTIQDFNKFFKSWSDSSGIPISNFQIKGKDLRPVL